MTNMFGDYYSAFDYSWSPAKHPKPEASSEVIVSGKSGPSSSSNSMFRKEVGATVAEVKGNFRDVLDQKIKMGAMNVELQVGMSNDMMKGPETYGKEARQDIKRLAEVNEVDIQSVHAPPDKTGLSGWDGRPDGSFRREIADDVVNTMKSSVDFAADVTHGGSVVVHLGEMPRSVTEADAKFHDYDDSEPNKQISLADASSGKIISVDRNFEVPDYQLDPETNLPKGSWDETDPENPVYKMPTGTKKFEDFKQEVTTNKEKFLEDYDLQETGEYTGTQFTPDQLAEQAVLKGYFKKQIDQLNVSLAEANGELYQFTQQKKKAFEDLGYDEETKRDNDEKKEVWIRKAKRKAAEDGVNLTDEQAEELRNDEIKGTSRFYDTRINPLKSKIFQVSQDLDQRDRSYHNLKPLEEVGLKKTADSLAKLGIYAMEKTKEKNLDRPLTITPENLMPNTYGGHIDEVVKVIEKARQEFVQRLSESKIKDPFGRMVKVENPEDPDKPKEVVAEIENPYYSPEFAGPEGKAKAKKLAEKHIKATLDFQHLGMWSKHFKVDPNNATPEQKKKLAAGMFEEVRIEQFGEWYKEQVAKITDKPGILGNVHVVDGMGRGHVHLPLGQGVNTTLIGDALTELRDKGFDVPLVSEGWQEGEDRALLETWANSKRQMYTTDSGPVYWNQMQNAYIGAGRPPEYFFGKNVPNQEDYALGTGVNID